MPKMFIHSREGTFPAAARARVAAALTDLGLSCERLPDTPGVRRGVWVFFQDHAPDAVFSGGEVASLPLMTLVVLALKGGLDGTGRQRLIEGATAILGEHAAVASNPVPAFVVIREVPEADWGMYGHAISLAKLRAGG